MWGRDGNSWPRSCSLLCPLSTWTSTPVSLCTTTQISCFPRSASFSCFLVSTYAAENSSQDPLHTRFPFSTHPSLPSLYPLRQILEKLIGPVHLPVGLPACPISCDQGGWPVKQAWPPGLTLSVRLSLGASTPRREHGWEGPSEGAYR